MDAPASTWESSPTLGVICALASPAAEGARSGPCSSWGSRCSSSSCGAAFAGPQPGRPRAGARPDLPDRHRVAPDGSTHPRGLLTLFAIHGTAVPSANSLYDPHIHGRVARLVEPRLGSGEGHSDPSGVHRDVVHLFANGAAADISPGVPPSNRRPVARKRTLVPALVAALAPGARPRCLSWDPSRGWWRQRRTTPAPRPSR